MKLSSDPEYMFDAVVDDLLEEAIHYLAELDALCWCRCHRNHGERDEDGNRKMLIDVLSRLVEYDPDFRPLHAYAVEKINCENESYQDDCDALWDWLRALLYK